ncbi:MAG: M24 family metallopeptidase [bacterium]|nr:M24 family metallopeptidase [bacterium]
MTAHLYSAKDLLKYVDLCARLSECFDEVEPNLTVGRNLLRIQAQVETLMARHRLESAFRYKGFPALVMTGINDEINNRQPTDRNLKNGDWLNFHIGVRKDGLFAYQGWTYLIGEAPVRDGQIIATGKETLRRAVATAGVGVSVQKIAAAIESTLNEGGLFPCRHFVGHGFGPDFHCEPSIATYAKTPVRDKLKPGMVISIVVMGLEEDDEIKIMQDDWGIKTRNGGRGLFFSQMLAVEKRGVTVLAGPRSPN